MASTSMSKIVVILHVFGHLNSRGIHLRPRIHNDAGGVALTGELCLHGSFSRTLGSFCVTICGLDSSSVLSSLLKPRSLPMIPGGFGTGHSCAFFLMKAFSSSGICSGICFLLSTPVPSSTEACDVRRLLLRLPSSMTSKSESANWTRGAGHGRICGMPTTKKDTRRVVPKREVVRRDRGWRWGVMVERIEKFFKAEKRSSCCCYLCDRSATKHQQIQIAERGFTRYTFALSVV